MKNIKIVVIAGDGIGKEVMKEGIRLLREIEDIDKGIRFELTELPWGCDYYEQHHEMMPENGIELLSKYDAILLGAIGSPSVADHISLRDLLLKIRKSFDQYINLRPIKLLEGAYCPLKNKGTKDIDMIFIRENSEGEYAGSGYHLFEGSKNETVIQNSVFSRQGCERVIRYAFELAKSKKCSLTNVSKANALNYSMVFWDQIFEEVASEYPDVITQHYLVDAASMMMITHPEKFKIVVTTNLFGDILTDLGAAIAGGMGLAAGANLNPEKKFPSMFEPIHGSAFDIAGKGIANPLATFYSVSQLLDFFGEKEWGKRIIDVMELMLVEQRVLTPDSGGLARTWEVTDEFIRLLHRFKQ